MNSSPFSMALVLLAVAQCSVAGQQTAWLIYPGVAGSPLIERSTDKPATWRLKSRQGQILAELKQPALPNGYTVNLGQCKMAGVLRDDVLAFVRHEPGLQWSHKVAKLWIADPAKRAFETSRTEGVSCLNESYGV
jgi:hypothetical protein